MLSLFSHVPLCDPVDYSPPAPLYTRISRQLYWSGLPGPTPGDLPDPGIKHESLTSPALAGFFTTCATWDAFISYISYIKYAVLSHSVVSESATPWTEACWVPLCMEILQGRILEWDAMPSFRGSSQPRDWIQVSHISGRFCKVWATRGVQYLIAIMWNYTHTHTRRYVMYYIMNVQVYIMHHIIYIMYIALCYA